MTRAERRTKRHVPGRPRPVARRSGFSLIEIMIALTILAIVLSTLAGLSLRVSQRMRTNEVRTFRQAELSKQANRFAAMPFSELSAAAVNLTVDTGAFPHTRTIRRVNVSSLSLDSIVITITPRSATTLRDSIAVVRVNPPYNPLSMP